LGKKKKLRGGSTINFGGKCRMWLENLPNRLGGASPAVKRRVNTGRTTSRARRAFSVSETSRLGRGRGVVEPNGRGEGDRTETKAKPRVGGQFVIPCGSVTFWHKALPGKGG